MNFKLLVIEDDDEFYNNMKFFLDRKIREFNENSNIKLYFYRAKDLEIAKKEINNRYYIGYSIDQQIPNSKGDVDKEFGAEATKTIFKSNIISLKIMLSNYSFDIKFSGYVKEEAYFHKPSDDLEDWANYLVENSVKYITEDIFEDAINYLPLSLGNILHRYNIDKEQDKIKSLISFFELNLRYIYASVLCAIGKKSRNIWQNIKMISELKEIKENIDKYSLSIIKKEEISKLLSDELLDTLDKIRVLRNNVTHSHKEYILTKKDKLLFSLLLLYDNYFYTNPFIYIQNHTMKNNSLKVNAQKLIGNPSRYKFEQLSPPYVNEEEIYQIFREDSKEIISLSHYFQRDKTQYIINIEVK